MKKTCAIVIPIYNEADVIAETLKDVRGLVGALPDWSFEIVCVNDGSADDTARVLKAESGITVLNHHINRGYGAALRTGLDACRQEWIAIVDADGTYPIPDLVRMLQSVTDETHMVVGARRGAGISVSPHKRLARWVLRKMVHALTGVMVPDLNSGMRVFRRALYLEFAHLLPMGFSFTTTLTVSSLYRGFRIDYTPIDYMKRKGKSHIRPLQDFVNFTILIVRLASYFEPLRFFVPLSMIIFALGILRAIRDVIITNAFGTASEVMLLLSLQVFLTGVIADVVVRRSQANTLRIDPSKE